MNKQFLKDSLGWGIILWMIGYALGMIFFTIMPANLIGWVIMPIGIVLTFYIVLKKVKGETWWYYLWLGVTWLLIAIIADYFFLVKPFQPADGYYKLDVYLYYFLTFAIPLGVGLRKNSRRPAE